MMVEIEQNAMEIRSSKQYNSVYIVLTCIILLFWGICWFCFEFGKLFITILSVVLIAIVFLLWISSSRTLLIDESGCTIRLLNVTRKYSWSEINVAKVDYTGMIGYRDPYIGGVIFSVGKAKKPRFFKPSTYAAFCNPLKVFFVNFEPDRGYNKAVCCPDLYAVPQNAFLEKIHSWGIEIG